MKQISLLLAAVSAVFCQRLNFGGKTKVNTRLGLLADELGLSATGEQQGRQNGFQGQGQGQGFQQTQGQPNAPFIQEGGGEFGGGVPRSDDYCCCIPYNQQCQGQIQEVVDLVGSGLIDARAKPKPQGSISTRIVNRPSAKENTNAKQTTDPQGYVRTCKIGEKPCCIQNDEIDLGVFGRSCVTPKIERWSQGCNERLRSSSSVKTCGTRGYNRPLSGLDHAEASPGEFPWTCLLLNQNNDFIGTCALIPASSSNDNSQGVKVITAAHKLKALGEYDLLKVRVGEYDASGYNSRTEQQEHVEYNVTLIKKHEQFSARRLSNDLAILYVDRPISLNHPYVNTACLPSCDKQFDYRYFNGTGVRCWVAGYGKDEFTGDFQFIPHKVDLPIVDQASCQASLKSALNRQKPRSGNNFRLSPSEICAGGQEGKDACTGDGGSPLVCQAQSGRWTVVGLVTWGVGCASTVPGVYARISNFLSWIDRN